MKKYRLFISASLLLSLTACTTFTEETIEPNASYALLKTNAKNFSVGLPISFSYSSSPAKATDPNKFYELGIAQIDGKELGAIASGNSVQISPGAHTVTVNCLIAHSDATCGNKTLHFTATAGHTYLITLPPALHAIDYQAADKAYIAVSK